MKQFPSTPRLEDAPPDLLDGHLWLVEYVDGAPFRFQLQDSGRLRFGDDQRVYDPDDVPAPYQHAVRHVQERLDRTALREAVENVTDIVFFGTAMHRQAIEYDWDRTPSFLGSDVWDAGNDQFRPVTSVGKIFDQLGLDAVAVFERERNARDFDPDSYTIPASGYYDGPAAGVVVRNKQGQRGLLPNPDVATPDETPVVDASATELAGRYATDRRFERVASSLEDRGWDVTVDVLYERTLDDILRANHRTLFEGTRSVDMAAFRSEVAALTQSFLDDRDT
jgi:hypothetical protein